MDQFLGSCPYTIGRFPRQSVAAAVTLLLYFRGFEQDGLALRQLVRIIEQVLVDSDRRLTGLWLVARE
jgi:hypothetical protein